MNTERPHYPKTLTNMAVPPPSFSNVDVRIETYFRQFQGHRPMLLLPLRGSTMRVKKALWWLKPKGAGLVPIGPAPSSIEFAPHLRLTPLADSYAQMHRQMGIGLPEPFVKKALQSPVWYETRMAFMELCAKRLSEPYAEWASRAFIDAVHMECLLYSISRPSDAARVGTLVQLFKDGNLPFAYNPEEGLVWAFCAEQTRFPHRPTYTPT